MITFSQDILDKHSVGIQAAMNYYVLNQPTGLSDFEYDRLENEARKDGLELRDYVTQFIQGHRFQNADYIGKVEKAQVTGIMKDALLDFKKKHSEIDHWLPKYDGSSLAAYYDHSTGKCLRIVTVGGTNLGGEGIDQTEKFIRYFPDLPNTGICCLQCECLVSLENGLGDKSRQKANGLVNSSYQPLSRNEFKLGKGTDTEYSRYLRDFQENNIKVQQEVDELITLRCFRYYLDMSSKYSGYTRSLGQEVVLSSFPVVYNGRGDIKFCGGYTFKTLGDFVEHDIWKTPTGTFLVDGVVGYTFDGICVKALKYKDAGRGEATEVLSIKWNDQSSKGKDSWSANAIISPILVRGTKITKPTVGSVKKMLESGLSPGAKVTIILANSTIPQVSKVISPGNLDYNWPTCKCGWKLGPKDIYGTLVKCGNPECTYREERMRKYLRSCSSFSDIDLNRLLILDRWNWDKKISNLSNFLVGLYNILKNNLGYDRFLEYLSAPLTTDLLRRNLKLVSKPAYKTLLEYVRYN